MKSRHGFTLIELLVVISIISVLMGVLMPALRRVREQAKQQTCASRERQHIFALTMYAGENDTKFPLPPNAGYWLWDINVNTVNFMLKSGLTSEIFYCPANQTQQKYMDLYWEYGDNEWDGSRFTSGNYVVSGYCYMLETAQSPHRPKIREDADTTLKSNTGRKKWVKTTQDKNASNTELVIDATLGDPDADAKFGYNFAQVATGGMWSQYQIYDRTSHLLSDEEPSGGNMGFVDGHVDWRRFDLMQSRFGGSGIPTFWW